MFLYIIFINKIIEFAFCQIHFKLRILKTYTKQSQQYIEKCNGIKIYYVSNHLSLFRIYFESKRSSAGNYRIFYDS